MPSIFLLDMDTRLDLGMTFLRVQEFYESPNDNFRGKKFTLEEYKNWYISQSKKETFSYCEDWSGFNTPSHIINACYATHNERLSYDEFFLSIANVCEQRTEKNNKSYYLLGTCGLDEKTLPHEIAHGLYTTNSSYKIKMDSLLDDMHAEDLIELENIIANIGYGEDTLRDEAHAYLSTGLVKGMKNNKFKIYEKPFINLFQSYVINWSMPEPIIIS